MTGKIFIITAPSAAGKTSLVNALLKVVPLSLKLEKSVTYTTRLPRVGELEGIDYHFITRVEFLEKLNDGFFLEHNYLYGNYYGSSKEMIQKRQRGISTVIILDHEGAKAVKKLIPEVIIVWIHPPSLEELKWRIKNRQSDILLDELELRLQSMQQEMSGLETEFYDYMIINDNFERALCELKKIIIGNICS
jgi:guanylate kinase